MAIKIIQNLKSYTCDHQNLYWTYCKQTVFDKTTGFVQSNAMHQGKIVLIDSLGLFRTCTKMLSLKHKTSKPPERKSNIKKFTQLIKGRHDFALISKCPNKHFICHTANKHYYSCTKTALRQCLYISHDRMWNSNPARNNCHPHQPPNLQWQIHTMLRSLFQQSKFN